MESTEVTTQQKNEVAAAPIASTMQASDLYVPRMVLAQAMTKVAQNPEVDIAVGDFYLTGSNKKFGDSFYFMPLSWKKIWTTLTAKGGKFVRLVPFTQDTIEMPFEERIDGVDVKNLLTYEFMGLVADKLETEEDLDDAQLVVFSMRSTHAMAAKEMLSYFEQVNVNREARGADKMLPYERKFKIGRTMAEKDDNQWWKTQIGDNQKTNELERKLGKVWFDKLSQVKVRTDDEFKENSGQVENTEAADFEV